MVQPIPCRSSRCARRESIAARNLRWRYPASVVRRTRITIPAVDEVATKANSVEKNNVQTRALLFIGYFEAAGGSYTTPARPQSPLCARQGLAYFPLPLQ